MAEKKFDEAVLNDIVNYLVETPSEIETRYIKPCRETYTNCGLTGAFKTMVDNAVEALANAFAEDMKAINQVGDNFKSYNEEYKKRIEDAMAKFAKLQKTSEDHEKTEVAERQKRAF